MFHLMGCIHWKMNFDFPNNTTIHDAIRFGEQGLDMGVRGCFMVKPTDKNDVSGHIMWEGYLLSLCNELPRDLYLQ